MTKADRVKANQLAAAERIGKRALSLTVALLRAKVLRESLKEPLNRQATSGKSADTLRAEAADQALQLQPTDASRVDSLYSFYLGALYAVVEKWRDWDFADAAVDTILADKERVEVLEKHRHAIFHAEHYDDKAIAALAEREDMIPWADELASALEKVFLAWHSDREPHIRAHLQRTGA
ncbi:MAG TPA: hypothetical protein VEK78_04315 [Gemmatimonadales bacterium]|nr:hypothetical protein [Gemmatimonadales bacterium]